ncbi:hypothetical protein ACWEPC_57635 [Nonomuraea sp. NPDC004297]
MTRSVGVVVPTRGDRPAWLREAVDAVLAQDYAGVLKRFFATRRIR